MSEYEDAVGTVLPESKPLPKANTKRKAIPKESKEEKPLPEEAIHDKPLPEEYNPEDVVVVGGKKILIKPTKVRYHRDRTAAFYHVLDVYPLPDVLAMDKGVLDANRDGDKCLFDWLCAVFDDVELVKANYEEMDSTLIDKLVAIFKRLNGIDEKEEQAKNRAAKETRA